MMRWLAGLWAIVLIIGLWGEPAYAEAPGARDANSATARAWVTREGGSGTEQAAGSMTLVEPGPDGVTYEMSPYVWMGLKAVKGAACFSFDVERTETKTTITTSCYAGKKKGKAWGNFEVGFTIWDGNHGQGVDLCQKRQNLKHNPVFTCTVPNSDIPTVLE
jgi:hypothetical protein